MAVGTALTGDTEADAVGGPTGGTAHGGRLRGEARGLPEAPRVEFLPRHRLRTPVGEAAASPGRSVRARHGDATLSEMPPAVSIPSKEPTRCRFSSGIGGAPGGGGSFPQLPRMASSPAPPRPAPRCEETRPRPRQRHQGPSPTPSTTLRLGSQLYLALRDAPPALPVPSSSGHSPRVRGFPRRPPRACVLRSASPSPSSHVPLPATKPRPLALPVHWQTLSVSFLFFFSLKTSLFCLRS